MKLLFFYLFLFILIYFATSASQLHPEINDQFENVTTNSNTINDSTYTTASTAKSNIHDVTEENNEILDAEIETIPNNTNIEVADTKPSVLSILYNLIKMPIMKLVQSPKVNTVLRNIGTCIVNGVMEIVSYYFPAPLIPLIASAAGMVIPFEPVVMLRRRMPVTSYRRAIKTAVNSFMNTFDAYKFDNNYEDDPYMTRRFNRRFMNDAKDETKKEDEDVDRNLNIREDKIKNNDK